MNTRNAKGVENALLLLALAALVTACASAQKIDSDYDRGADFSKFKTYNYFSDAGGDKSNYTSLFTQYMIAAIDREMQSRGYVKSPDPDLLVNFNANFQDLSV